MIHSTKHAVTITVISLFFMTLTGCQKPEGPAQKAGKAIDQGAAKAGEQIQKAGDSLENAAKDRP